MVTSQRVTNNELVC